MRMVVLAVCFMSVFWLGYFSGRNSPEISLLSIPFKIPKCFHSRQEKERPVKPFKFNNKLAYPSGEFVEIVGCEEWDEPNGDR